MTILSIDSGLEKTGYSIFEKEGKGFTFITSGLIRTDKKNALEKRIEQIYRELGRVIAKYRPHKIIVERLFFTKNHKTAISIGQAQGITLLLAGESDIIVEFLTPLQIKQIVTGYGNSDKKSVRKMVDLTLQIKRTIKEDDEIDAIACGLAYCYLHR